MNQGLKSESDRNLWTIKNGYGQNEDNENVASNLLRGTNQVFQSPTCNNSSQNPTIRGNSVLIEARPV